MPTAFLPYIIPNSIEFNICNEYSLTQTVCIYNPYAFDILFKVDNAQPQKYTVSNRQGLISSRQKLPIDITCRVHELAAKDQIQVRFFKWPRPRHGQKPRAQNFIGYRELNLSVTDDRSRRERTPSQASDRFSSLTPTSSPAHHDLLSSTPKPGSLNTSIGSNADWQGMDETFQHHAYDRQRFQVISNIILSVVLVLTGFLLNQANEDWFSINVMDGVKPQTLAIVAYTLAGVVIFKLLTFR